jgi:hypothetical protein
VRPRHDGVEHLKTVVYGYRYGEVTLPPMATKLSIKFPKGFLKTFPYPKQRAPVKVSLPFHFNFTQPHPCVDDPLTTLSGVMKRLAFKHDLPNNSFLCEFERFVIQYIKENFVPLSACLDVSVETWLESCPYPKWRKDELLKLHQQSRVWQDSFGELSCFIKDESYSCYKFPRGIYSRSDSFKLKMGPISKLISDVFFKLPETIKKITINDRPKYILDNLKREGSVYIATDYTSFESSFTSLLQRKCERHFYEYMVSQLAQGPEFLQFFDQYILSNKQRCKFKFFSFDVECRRMSGEMFTSLGNTFTNMLIMKFLCKINDAECRMVVEGDDGLTSIVGPLPTEDQFHKLGFQIKLEQFDRVSEASFCGLIFDEDEKQNITNPIDVLAELGWCKSSYRDASYPVRLRLLKAKCLSFLYQYPACPIINVLCDRLLSRLTYVTPLFPWENIYDEELRLEILNNLKNIKLIEPGPGTRELMERKFSITTHDQLLIEKELSKIQFGVFNSRNSLLQKYVPNIYYEYFDKYSLAVDCDYAKPPETHVRESYMSLFKGLISSYDGSPFRGN